MDNRKRRDARKKKQREAEARRARRLRQKGVEFKVVGDKVVPTKIPLNAETAEALKHVEEAYKAKTGKPIPPNMPLGEVFKELRGPDFEEAYVPTLMQNMWAAGLDPAKIYATWKSDGLLPTEENMDLIDPDVLDEFDRCLDEFIEIVGRGENPFIGSALETQWQNERRPSSIVADARDDDVDQAELHLPLPYTKEEWQGGTISSIMNDKRFERYYTDCVARIHKSGRSKGYMDLFTMIMHIGRFPEFDRKSYGKFLREAQAQPMTAKKLVNSLEIVLAVSGPNEALPTAATAFEFLALVNDFAQFMTDRLNAGPRAKELVVNLGTMAMMAFIVAMNVEYGLIDRNDWEFGSSDQSG
jgi:hypothetical protein